MIKVDLGKVIQIIQNHALILRANHFRTSFICPRFGGRFCTPCINVPQVSGRLMHPMHKRAPGFRQTYAPRA